MEKVYLNLDWLEMGQAIDWLQDLTGTPVTHIELLQLCDSKQCDAYADVDGLTADELGFDTGAARGIHLVTNPLQAFGTEWRPRETKTKGDTYTQVGASLAFTDIPPWKRGPIFQPSDIQALADRMNRTANQPTIVELEGLRQELERERSTRVMAEAEAERLRDNAERSDLALRMMHSRAEQERTALVIAEAEAERLRIQAGNSDRECQMWSLHAQQTEAKVAALRKEIEDIHNAQQAKEHVEADEAYHRQLGWQLNITSEATPTGLTFPYATKELEAMRTAALKYWADHAPDKRHPTQKEIGHELCELLRLPRQANNDPARKAIVLATAIRPDTLMDA